LGSLTSAIAPIAKIKHRGDHLWQREAVFVGERTTAAAGCPRPHTPTMSPRTAHGC